MTSVPKRWGSSRLALSVSMVALLSACAMQPEPFSPGELSGQATADRGDMFAAGDPLTKPLTLADAIARALKNNLDHRTKMMEEALALGQRDLDRWDLLPKVTASAGYIGRSVPNVSTSRDVVTQQPSASNPTVSTDRDRITGDLGLSWNVLDFGVSYYTAHQNADRALIAAEHRRKTIHNLVNEVTAAYWRTVAAQAMQTKVADAVRMAEKALADAEKVEKANLKSPAESLRYQKTVLENLRQLEGVAQDLSTAHIELAALINVPPSSDLRVQVPDDASMTMPKWSIPVDKMEEMAFVNNPDLREQMYQSRIAVDETKKTMLKLLPGITFSGSRQYDSNSFLVDNRWYETGARLSFNLLNVLTGPDQIDQAEAGEKVAKARRVALRMAVLAQVHVAWRGFLNNSKQFERADKLFQIESRLAKNTSVRTENDAQSVQERIGAETSAINAEVRRFQAYSVLESTVAKMHATIGQDFLPDSVAGHDLDAVGVAVAKGLEMWQGGDVPVPVPVVLAVSPLVAPAAAPASVVTPAVAVSAAPAAVGAVAAAPAPASAPAPAVSPVVAVAPQASPAPLSVVVVTPQAAPVAEALSPAAKADDESIGLFRRLGAWLSAPAVEAAAPAAPVVDAPPVAVVEEVKAAPVVAAKAPAKPRAPTTVKTALLARAMSFDEPVRRK